MKKIYFVRHGETEANVAQIISGGEHDAMLTDKGRSQAKKAGKDLRNKNIQLIICSPLTRARESAAIIAEEIGYDSKKIQVSELFLEQKMGPYSGKPYDYLNKHKEKGTLLPGRELPEELHKRVGEAIDFLRAQKEDTILVVSHGATGRMLKIVHQELPHSDIHQVGKIGNAEIIEFEF